MAPETREHPREKLPPAVNNHGLFSDYYLTELVQDDSFFQESKRAAEPVWRAIKDLYDKVKGELPTANEARTDQLFIHPVLDLLGQKGHRHSGGHRPDTQKSRRTAYWLAFPGVPFRNLQSCAMSVSTPFGILCQV